MGASEAGATAYRRAGLRVLEIGDEAVLTVARFDLDDPDLRAGPAERAAAAPRRVHGADPPARSLSAGRRWTGSWSCADGWRARRDRARLLDGAVPARRPGRRRLRGRRGPGRRRRAAWRCCRSCPWGAHGLSLDLMRRDPDAANGLTELMVDRAGGPRRRARGRAGVAELRGVPFGVRGRRADRRRARWRAPGGGCCWSRRGGGSWSRCTARTSKYRPEWVPRFLCYSERARTRQDLAGLGRRRGLPHPAGGPAARAPADAADRRRRSPASRRRPDVRRGAAAHPTGPAVAAVAAHVAAPTGAGPGPARDPGAAARGEDVDPYPVGYPRTATAAEVRAAHAGLPPVAHRRRGRVAGRVVAVRDHGGVCFAMLRDWSGDLQVLLERDRLGRPRLARFAATSTSATTSASRARWSRPAAASCRWPPARGR